jgi:hypothetical protein
VRCRCPYTASNSKRLKDDSCSFVLLVKINNNHRRAHFVAIEQLFEHPKFRPEPDAPTQLVAPTFWGASRVQSSDTKLSAVCCCCRVSEKGHRPVLRVSIPIGGEAFSSLHYDHLRRRFFSSSDPRRRTTCKLPFKCVYFSQKLFTRISDEPIHGLHGDERDESL